MTENIGHRASIYVEEYTLSSGMRSGDAIIAATAVENNLVLVSSNVKHFKAVKDLQLNPSSRKITRFNPEAHCGHTSNVPTSVAGARQKSAAGLCCAPSSGWGYSRRWGGIAV